MGDIKLGEKQTKHSYGLSEIDLVDVVEKARLEGFRVEQDNAPTEPPRWVVLEGSTEVVGEITSSSRSNDVTPYRMDALDPSDFLHFMQQVRRGTIPNY